MTMRQQSHPIGSFPACPQCRKEPRHNVSFTVRSRGTVTRLQVPA
jgi:hypothetical protein